MRTDISVARKQSAMPLDYSSDEVLAVPHSAPCDMFTHYKPPYTAISSLACQYSLPTVNEG
jgi:hypothetical protein